MNLIKMAEYIKPTFLLTGTVFQFNLCICPHGTEFIKIFQQHLWICSICDIEISCEQNNLTSSTVNSAPIASNINACSFKLYRKNIHRVRNMNKIRSTIRALARFTYIPANRDTQKGGIPKTTICVQRGGWQQTNLLISRNWLISRSQWFPT
jgi:hypothetical protein